MFGFVPAVCISEAHALSELCREERARRKVTVSVKPEGEVVCDSLWGRGAWQVPVLPGACNTATVMPDLQAGITSQASARVSCLDQAGDTFFFLRKKKQLCMGDTVLKPWQLALGFVFFFY